MSRLLCYVFGFRPGFSSFLDVQDCGLFLSLSFLYFFELTIEHRVLSINWVSKQ